MVYYLVKFEDDGILYICPETNVRRRSGNTAFVRYRAHGSFKAKIISSGSKTDLNKLKAEMLCLEDDDSNVTRETNFSEQKNSSNTNAHYFDTKSLRSVHIDNCRKRLDFDTESLESVHINKCRKQLNMNICSSQSSISNTAVTQNNPLNDSVYLVEPTGVVEETHRRETPGIVKDHDMENCELLNAADSNEVQELENCEILNAPGNTEIQELRNSEILHEAKGTVNDIMVLSNIPICPAVIKIDLKNGDINITVENTLHSGIYSGSAFTQANSNIIYGILTENVNQLHENCSLHEANKPFGFVKFDVTKLDYECNLICCLTVGNFHCQGYFVNNSTLIVGEIKQQIIALENISSSNEVVDNKSNEGNNIKNKRKQHFCPFCKKLYSAIGRHLLSQHKKEEDIIQILALPKSSQERKKKLSLLRCKGMHMYNMKNSFNEEDLLVVRKPSINTRRSFVPCPNCLGYFLPRNVARHQRRCVNRPANKSQILCIAKQLRLPDAGVEGVLVQQLLSQLRDDEITNTIRNDKVLLLLASKMAIKYAKEKHLGNFMRQKLRQLARLLIAIRKIDNEIKDFESCLVPHKYNSIKNAIYELCELDLSNFTYKRPSLASQLGAMIKDSVYVLQVQNIKDGLRNSKQQQDLDDFLLIHEKEYGALVAKSAVTTLEQSNWNKIQIMPSVDDIKKFQDYLKIRAENSYTSLSNTGFDYNTWLTLGKSCLLILLTFNRRRIGEMSRILLENFKKRQAITDEQYKTLSRLERILANLFQRIEIRGKKGRRVPVLLTSRHVDYIEMFLKFRERAGVSESNPFVFGLSHKKGYIDAAIAIRQYSNKCGASDPHTLRGTFLRKQVATISQMLNLNDTEIQQLADFMGHDVAIHRLHYRKPELSLQITRLAKFFMAMSEPDLEKYRGKTLDDIEVTAPPDNDIDSSTSSDVESINSNDVDNLQDKSTSQSINNNRKLKRTSAKLITSPYSVSSSLKKSTPNKSPLRHHCPQLHILSSIKSPVRRFVRKRLTWSSEERSIINKEFEHHLLNKTLPSFKECARFRQKYAPIFINRNIATIKAWVYNQHKHINI